MYALQLILNMTQTVSQWFYMLDLNNQTFLIKVLEILAFNIFFYHRPEGGDAMVRICMRVRPVFIRQLDMNNNQKKALRKDNFHTWAILYDSIDA